jgi:hypothetical protein
VTLLLEVLIGFFGKGNAFFYREAAYTVTKFRPDWLDDLKGFGGLVGMGTHVYSSLLWTTPSRHTVCTVVSLYYSSALESTSHHFSNTASVFIEDFPSSHESAVLGLLRFFPFMQCFSFWIVLGVEMKTLLLR